MANPIHSTPRQTVMQAKTDSDGRADFLSIGSGLAVNVDCTTPDLVVSASDGFGSAGALEYVGVKNSDTTISSLTASSTCYLYTEVDSGGALTFGHSTIEPVCAYAAPTGPSTDQHWFDLATWKMKRYTGSAWEEKKRVFLGEAVTDGSSVTSVTNYALGGLFVSDITSWYQSQNVSFDHCLGVGPEYQNVTVVFSAKSDFSNPYSIDAVDLGKDIDYGYGLRGWSATSLAVKLGKRQRAEAIHEGYLSSGYVRVVVKRSF